MGINHFRRDERDLKFLIFEQFNIDNILNYEAFKDFSRDDFGMLIDEAFKVGREILGPTMQDGDRIGCKFENQTVTTPDSWKENLKFMNENGWTGIGSNPEYGGQGLPAAIAGPTSEVFNGSNMAFMMFPGLSLSASRVIEQYGTEADKTLFCEKMNTGVWHGTMCLTEPDAGSDVGYLRTKATPDPDSDDPRIFKIEGDKRFISCGDHDLTENIIHLVLARVEGAPMGTKGISLFIVPKIKVNQDGSLGESNDVACTGIEHKMGLHGSPTSSMVFGENGECRGVLLGEANSGMSKMFQMMNEARLGCGVQSLALAASAYDAARCYAKERVQGPPFTDRSADRVPIIQHEDIRRMLLKLKSGTEAMRALLTKIFFLVDTAHHDPDEDQRKKAIRRIELLTPLSKAYHSDFSYELIRDAIQVLGGVGYCSEFPIEQYARDCKILSIWEGTSYIQSLDLVGRKLGMEGGLVFQDWFQEITDLTSELKDDDEFGGDSKLLYKAVQAVGDYAMRFMNYFKDDKLQLIPLASLNFLYSMAEVELARLMLEQALISRKKLKDANPDSADGVFYQGKIASAKFYCRNTLTNVFGRHMTLVQEDMSAIEIPEAAF